MGDRAGRVGGGGTWVGSDGRRAWGATQGRERGRGHATAASTACPDVSACHVQTASRARAGGRAVASGAGATARVSRGCLRRGAAPTLAHVPCRRWRRAACAARQDGGAGGPARRRGRGWAARGSRGVRHSLTSRGAPATHNVLRGAPAGESATGPAAATAASRNRGAPTPLPCPAAGARLASPARERRPPSR